MNLQNLNLELQLSLAEKLAGLPSSTMFNQRISNSAAPSAASNLPQKLVETQICMHERELEALESIALLQQREATISRLDGKLVKLQQALASSQCATAQTQSRLESFAGITPQDVKNLRSKNASLQTQLAALQQQLETQAAHTQDLTQYAARVQRALKKEADEASTELSKKEAKCRALQQEQVLLKSKVELLEAVVGPKESALHLSLELENSNLNHHTATISNIGVYADVMELQKELAAALNRVWQRESQCRKYKEAVRSLKSRLEQEQKHRNEAEKQAAATVEQCSTAGARQQQMKEASREACAAAVRLAEGRAIEAEGKVAKLEAAVSQLQKTQRPSLVNTGEEKANLKKEIENQNRLHQALALNVQLREGLQQEKAQRSQQERVLASKAKALAEAEKRQKQLDGIIKRLAAHQGWVGGWGANLTVATIDTRS
ncbi:hypothetical protein Ndes2437B_g01985 [Nannochloris sp. 'desiccata']|nr:hypothetical protein KSW81_007003 [Chlorella desiccata (nom. nud.)]